MNACSHWPVWCQKAAGILNELYVMARQRRATGSLTSQGLPYRLCYIRSIQRQETTSDGKDSYPCESASNTCEAPRVQNLSYTRRSLVLSCFLYYSCLLHTPKSKGLRSWLGHLRRNRTNYQPSPIL